MSTRKIPIAQPIQQQPQTAFGVQVTPDGNIIVAFMAAGLMAQTVMDPGGALALAEKLQAAAGATRSQILVPAGVVRP